jgi:hypothetical protein
MSWPWSPITRPPRSAPTGSGSAPRLRQFRVEDSHLLDALTYADQTIGPVGEPTTIQRRLTDVLRRHGPHSLNAQVHHQRGPYLLAVGQRVEARLRDHRDGSAS